MPGRPVACTLHLNHASEKGSWQAHSYACALFALISSWRPSKMRRICRDAYFTGMYVLHIPISIHAAHWYLQRVCRYVCVYECASDRRSCMYPPAHSCLLRICNVYPQRIRIYWEYSPIYEWMYALATEFNNVGSWATLCCLFSSKSSRIHSWQVSQQVATCTYMAVRITSRANQVTSFPLYFSHSFFFFT